MHTITVIAGGLVLLGVCLLIARFAGRSPAAITVGAKCFLAIWLVAAAVNMWVGVTRAGYSIADEAPIFLVVFGIPAAAALVVSKVLSANRGR